MAKKKSDELSSVKEVPKPAEGEVICVVKKLLGAEHVQVLCLDGKERLGRIPGKLRKKMWVKEGDVVLVAPWDFQPNKCDIIYKYSEGELKKLEQEKIISFDLIEQLRG